MTRTTRIEELATQLVQQAPALDEGVIVELVSALRTNGAPLALAIATVVELVGQRTIDAGIALPALAMACGTLEDPRLTDHEREAARFEIETLLPLPAGAKKAPTLTAPDVPVTSLRRRPGLDR